MTTNSANTANTAIAKEAVETNGAQSQQTDPPTLQLDNVSYAYTKGGKRVLKNISHDFQAGKVHAITGPSGAGKTTLLSLISGLANPTEGMVLVDGTDLSERDRYRFRSHDSGVIFQSFNLLPNLTVAENIILSMGRVRQIVRQAEESNRRRIAQTGASAEGIRERADSAPVRRRTAACGDRPRVKPWSFHHRRGRADRQSRSGHAGRHHGYFPNVGA